MITDDHFIIGCLHGIGAGQMLLLLNDFSAGNFGYGFVHAFIAVGCAWLLEPVKTKKK
jgi:hypothetical protein